MPTWSNKLPEVQKHMGFDLRRTPESSALQAVSTSDDILVCDTHYWHGRTTPCEKPDCAACNEAMPYRTHVYVSAYDLKRREHFIFECTTNAAKAFVDYREANDTLRGCLFQAERPKGRKNSKVVIQTNTVNQAKINLPQPPNLILALSVIWRLPKTSLAVDGKVGEKKEVRTIKEPLDRMRNQPDNRPDPPRIGEIIGGNNEGKPTPARV